MRTVRNIILLIAILLSTGCGKRFYQKKENRPDALKLQDSVIVIDSTYSMYVRKVFKQATKKSDTAVREEIRGKGTGRSNDSLRLHRRADITLYQSVKTNNSDDAQPSNADLIEVEYLLYSEKQKRCIYFGTIPDKYEKYYAEHYNGDSIVNIFDFRVFFFGKLAGKTNTKQLRNSEREVSFKCRKNGRSDIWIIDKMRWNLITIDQVKEMKNDYLYDIYSVEHALSEPVAFKKVRKYRFAFRDVRNPEQLIYAGENKIYFKKERKGYSVYFSLEDGDEVFFDKSRTIYVPF